jgi:signal transduction histidine kinase
VLANRLLAAAFLSLIALCAQAQSDLIRERGIYVDETRSLGLQEVIAKEFEPYKGVLKRSLTPSIRWIRLKIDTSTTSEQSAVLVLGPHYIAEIALYERQNGEWSRRVVGDRYPAEQVGCPFGQYCFSVALGQKENNELYLRVETTNGYYLTAKLLDRLALNQEATDQALSAGLEFGVLLALIVMSVLLYFSGGGSLASYFLMTQVSALLLTLSALGIYAKYLTPETAWLDNFIFNTAYITRLFFSTLLSTAFLKYLTIPRWYSKLVTAVVVVFVAQLCWLVFEPVSLYGLAFNFIFVTFWPVVWLVALCQSGIKIVVHRVLMLSLASLMILMLWADMMPALGLAQVDRMIVPGNFGGLLVSIFMSFLVASEIRVRRLNNQAVLSNLAQTQARNELEHQQVKERSMMVDMLTHELKNPLAAIRMAAGSLKTTLLKLPQVQTFEANERIGSMIQAIHSMDTVIERCVQVDSLDQKKITPKPQELNMGDVLQDVVRHATDASRIKLQFNSPSMLVRTDPDLFAVIVTNLIDNALKYSAPDSSIIMMATLDRVGLFTLSVENVVGAAGTPDSASVFSRYYRGEHAHFLPGTGLGLYLVKSICDMLGARVSCQHSFGKIVFSVTLKS